MTALNKEGVEAASLVERDTHLLDWLPGAYHHCQHGSQDWCESYLTNAVDVIRSQDSRIEQLERQLSEAEEAENEAKDCFWAVYPTYVKTVGHGISTEAARTDLATRAEAAERQLATARDAHSWPPEAQFQYGDWVEKFTGEALWDGRVVSAYHTKRLALRYVVEVEPQGFQMIAVPAQLRSLQSEGGKP